MNDISVVAVDQYVYTVASFVISYDCIVFQQRSLAAMAVLEFIFSKNSKFKRLYGIYSDSTDRLASGWDLNNSHTLLERLRQERASSRPRVSSELAVHVAATLAFLQRILTPKLSLFIHSRKLVYYTGLASTLGNVV